MKLVGFPILKPLTFKCKILGQVESLKIIKDLYEGGGGGGAKLATQRLYSL